MSDDTYGDDGYEPEAGQEDGSETYSHESDGRRNDLLPCIVYLAEVETWEKVAASTGRMQFNVRFRIKEPTDHANRCIFWRTNFGKEFDWTRDQYFQATGRSGDFNWSPNLEVGTPVGILISHRPDGPNVWMDCKEFMPVTDPRVPGHEDYEDAAE